MCFRGCLSAFFPQVHMHVFFLQSLQPPPHPPPTHSSLPPPPHPPHTPSPPTLPTHHPQTGTRLSSLAKAAPSHTVADLSTALQGSGVGKVLKRYCRELQQEGAALGEHTKLARCVGGGYMVGWGWCGVWGHGWWWWCGGWGCCVHGGGVCKACAAVGV